MPSPDNALQSAVYQRLTTYAPLTNALGGAKVYDFVQPNLAAPYVVIGEDTMTGDDTKCGNGWDCTLTIHVWDFEKAGRKSVKALLSHIHDALHRQEASIAVTGYTLTQLIREFQTTIQEAAIEGENDHYYHGVARYRALLRAI
jgi:hypothetical protein